MGSPAGWRPEAVACGVSASGPSALSEEEAGGRVVVAKGVRDDGGRRNDVIDFDLIEPQFRHLMRVAVSIREGAISALLLWCLQAGSRENATCTAFREVRRVMGVGTGRRACRGVACSLPGRGGCRAR
ncbi:Tn3 family transposase [Streptomyces sp. CBMA156]|uniref:Tn3 family transposase n=1 Tax=Streptomyces sp. CBMA156 TaxID=1930280 RepID=UPI0016621476|nr:hypothetical protein [Streptomyces sp. CBMA156]